MNYNLAGEGVGGSIGGLEGTDVADCGLEGAKLFQNLTEASKPWSTNI